MKHKELFLFGIVHLIDLPITFYNTYFKSGILKEDNPLTRYLLTLNFNGWIILILLKFITLVLGVYAFIYWKRKHAKSYWIFFVLFLLGYIIVLIKTAL